MSAPGRRGLAALAATLCIAYLVAMLVTGALPRSRQLIPFEARGVLVQAPEQIRFVVLRSRDRELRFTRRDQDWIRDSDGAVLSQPDASTLSRAVKFMHTSAPVRVFQPQEISQSSLAEFGLEPPRLTVSLTDGHERVLEADFGNLNADGFLQYLRVEGRDELFLVSRFVGAEWSAVAAAQKP